MNIAIKLPDSIIEKVQTYPFLHALHKYLKNNIEKKNAEIEEEADHKVLNLYLISNHETVEILNLLPFHAYYQEFEEEDFNSIFSVHRAIVNSKLPDSFDLYISTTNSFVDASIGKNIGAEKRVGFSHGKNNFFLTDKVSFLQGRKYSEQVFELLRAVLEEMPSAIPTVCSKNMSEYYLDWRDNPYIMINLEVKDNEVLEHYKEFFDLCEHAHFVIMARDMDDEVYAEKLNQYIETLSFKNTYKLFDTKSLIDFSKAVSYCSTFITENNELMELAAYCGANIHHIYSNNHYQQYGDDYFYSEIMQFNLNEPIYKNGSEVLYNKVFDKIIEFVHKVVEDNKDDH